MCGICAAIGEKNQIEFVVKSLEKLEYRGYDSSGIGVIKKGKIFCHKSVGRIENLKKILPKNFKSKIAIAHTRWATHGKVSESNAHPHLSADKKIALVHNGILENFQTLKTQIGQDKYQSQTDSEVLANLLSKSKSFDEIDMIKELKKAKGSYAFAMIFEDEEKIFVGKNHSPLMVSHNKNFAAAASDMSVFYPHFDFCYILENEEFATLTSKNIVFFDKNGKKIKKNKVFLKNFDFESESLQDKYFMQKEINEQPTVLKKTFEKYKAENLIEKSIIENLEKFENFHFIGCGTAYHSAAIGSYFFEKYLQKNCKASMASEFRYSGAKVDKNTLYFFVSQSGETADTIACAQLVKNSGAQIAVVTNVDYSSLNAFANFSFPTFAGKEIAVASTKAYTAQIFLFALLVTALSKSEKLQSELADFVQNFCVKNFDESIFEKIKKFEKIFFVGRGQDAISSLEAALKLKEISYLNCSGMPAGELKHGTLALVDEDSLTIVISTQNETKEKIESNIAEIKSRGGKVLLVSNLKHDVEVDFEIALSSFDEIFLPIVSVVPLQQFALALAVHKGYDPDKPRNLAKSVTVE